MDFQALAANYQPVDLSASGKKRGRGGTATSLISELLGTAGGVGGFLVGGPVGAAGGSALFGGLGRALENKVRDDEWRPGDAVKEGLLSGALSAVVPGASAVKNLVKGGAKVATTTGTRNVVQRAAQGALGNAWNIKSGAKVAGKAVTPQRAASLQKFVVDTIKVPKAASADTVFENVTRFQDDAGKAISNALTAAVKPINTATVNKNITAKFSKVIGGNYQQNPVAKDIIKQVRQAKTPNELWQVRRRIDDSLISFGRNPNTATPGAETLAKAARTEINKALQDAVPDYKTLSRAYGDASDVAELVATAARTPKGARLPGFLGGIGGPQVQAIRSAVGQAGMKAGSGASGLAGALSSVPGKALRAGVRGPLLSAPFTGQSGENIDTTNTMPMTQSTASNMMSGLSGMTGDMSTENQTPWLPDGTSGPLDPATKQPLSPYTKANLLADIQRDPRNAEDYIKHYAMLDEIFNPEVEEAKPLTQGQQERTDLIKALDLTEGAVDAGSINFGPIGSRVEGLKSVFNAADEETLNFKNVVSGLRAAITKARAGASLTAGELTMLQKYTPSDTDSEQVVRAKLQALRQLYGYSAPTGGTTLEDALTQRGGF